MKLKDKNHTPVGGFFYICPITGKTFSTPSNLERLIDDVVRHYEANSIVVPLGIENLIEDQICMRQPANRCYGKGLGDALTSVIHSVAGAIDAVAGTQLKKKARRCSGCAKRRERLNQLSR